MRPRRNDKPEMPRLSVSDCLDKMPPADLGAEAALIGSAILSSSVIDEVLFVDENDFHDGAHATLWKTILEMHDKSKKIDEVTLVGELKRNSRLDEVGGSAAIVRLVQSCPSYAHATYYATEVRKASVKRQLLSAAAETVRDCTDDAYSPEDCLDRHESRVMGIGERELQTTVVDSAELMRSAIDLVDARQKGEFGDVLANTGFYDLDEMLGGMRAGQFIIIAARPGVGKTALAMNIAEHCAVDEKLPTMFVSLEMSSNELGDRLLSSKSGVSVHRMRTGNLSPVERTRLVEAASVGSQGKLHIVDDAMISVRKIAAQARRTKRKHGLNLVIVDYVQLIDPIDKSVPRQEQVAGIARGLKILSRELKVPLLCLAQLNRQSEESAGRPKLSHLRESGALEQDADAVIFIHREEIRRPEDDEVKGLAELIVAKQRNGPVGTVEVLWRREVMRFENLAPARNSDLDDYNRREGAFA